MNNKLDENLGRNSFWAFWVGPKLLFSVGKKGLQLNKRMEQILGVISPTNTVFLFGEIDIRTRPLELNKSKFASQSVVESYLHSLLEFCRRYGLSSPCVLQPPPPSKRLSNSKDFPTTGTIADRIQANTLIARELKIQSPAFGLKYIAFPESLVEADGSTREMYALDGVHTNSIANEIWIIEIISKLGES